MCRNRLAVHGATLRKGLASVEQPAPPVRVHRRQNGEIIFSRWESYKWDLASVPGIAAHSPVRSGTKHVIAAERQRKELISVTAATAAISLPGLTGKQDYTESRQEHHLLIDITTSVTTEQMTPLYLQLEPGEHHIACMDDSGQTASAVFSVQPG